MPLPLSARRRTPTAPTRPRDLGSAPAAPPHAPVGLCATSAAPSEVTRRSGATIVRSTATRGESVCAYHASVPALTSVRLTWSRAHARRHGHVSFRASRCRRWHGAAAIGERRYARLAAAAARALLPCVYHVSVAPKVVRHAGGRLEDLGGPRARMQDACMQTGWRSRPRHPSAGPGVKTGAPRVRVPPDAAGPRVNAHRFQQGSRAINDSFDCVQ